MSRFSLCVPVIDMHLSKMHTASCTITAGYRPHLLATHKGEVGNGNRWVDDPWDVLLIRLMLNVNAIVFSKDVLQCVVLEVCF